MARAVPRSDDKRDHRPSKQQYFDRYWATRETARSDRRTVERAELIWKTLACRTGRALDVGCGRGLFSAFMADRGIEVEAVDVSPLAVELTAARGVSARLSDIEREAPTKTYDLIFCLEILQQLSHPETVLRLLVGSLAPGGEIVVSLPNELHLARRVRKLFHLRRFAMPETSHQWSFTPESGEELLHRCELSVRTRLYTSLVPPRYRRSAQLARGAARLWPGALAMSSVYFAHRSP